MPIVVLSILCYKSLVIQIVFAFSQVEHFFL